MAFVSALSRCNEKSLQQFDFHCSSGMDDESAAKLIDIMATHRNLRKLSLWFKDANQQWIVALGNLLPLARATARIIRAKHVTGAVILANFGAVVLRRAALVWTGRCCGGAGTC